MDLGSDACKSKIWHGNSEVFQTELENRGGRSTGGKRGKLEYKWLFGSLPLQLSCMILKLLESDESMTYNLISEELIGKIVFLCLDSENE